MSNIERTELETVLDNFLETVIEKSRANLSSKGISASGALGNSFKGFVKESPNSIEATISAEDYLPFIDKGVEGVKSGKSLGGFKFKSKGGKRGLKGMPPPSAFDKWNVIRGRAGRDEKGRFLTRKQLNFRTAVGVFNYGIKPTSFFSDPFEEEFKKLPQELVEAYGLDVDIFMELVLKE